MIMSEYCPNTARCPFYLNWLDYTRNDRKDVIILQGHKENAHYDCLTLIALDDFETGIPIGQELKDRLSEANIKKIKCPLNSLHNSDFLEDRVNKLSVLTR